MSLFHLLPFSFGVFLRLLKSTEKCLFFAHFNR